MEVLVDTAFTLDFNQVDALFAALAYLWAVALLGVLGFRRSIVGPR